MIKFKSLFLLLICITNCTVIRYRFFSYYPFRLDGSGANLALFFSERNLEVVEFKADILMPKTSKITDEENKWYNDYGVNKYSLNTAWKYYRIDEPIQLGTYKFNSNQTYNFPLPVGKYTLLLQYKSDAELNLNKTVFLKELGKYSVKNRVGSKNELKFEEIE
ncbi:MAG TPA: hypothetical protein PK453_27030 [Leptospiraceae bacterium]|nr:hypothetical protein [Leptospiraceae bacterium]HNF25023.1 hypothetical protein [Leptospiraceae bacterium]HNM05968.1 hypothetical protein [Leptospiraceae bacterium]